MWLVTCHKNRPRAQQVFEDFTNLLKRKIKGNSFSKKKPTYALGTSPLQVCPLGKSSVFPIYVKERSKKNNLKKPYLGPQHLTSAGVPSWEKFCFSYLHEGKVEEKQFKKNLLRPSAPHLCRCALLGKVLF